MKIKNLMILAINTLIFIVLPPPLLLRLSLAVNIGMPKLLPRV